VNDEHLPPPGCSLQRRHLRLVKIDRKKALSIAGEAKTYAYDAYFIDCAVRLSAPLLSLDGGLKRAALKFGVKIMEI